MADVWQLQEAKNRLSEVVERALDRGPQLITRRGKETAIVLSYEEYRKLLLRKSTLSQFFQSSPMVGADLDLSRDPSPLRDDLDL